MSRLRLKRLPQNPPDRLRPRRLRLRLLRDPGVEGGVQLGVEAKADVRADSGPWAAALIFLVLGYCIRPRLLIPTTLSSEPEQGWHLAPALTNERLVVEAKDG